MSAFRLLQTVKRQRTIRVVVVVVVGKIAKTEKNVIAYV